MPEAFNNNLSLEVAFKEGYNFAVSNFGRLGGLIKSEAKTRAVRKNGKKGGRPKKEQSNMTPGFMNRPRNRRPGDMPLLEFTKKYLKAQS